MHKMLLLAPLTDVALSRTLAPQAGKGQGGTHNAVMASYDYQSQGLKEISIVRHEPCL
jgi:hypothetical protein